MLFPFSSRGEGHGMCFWTNKRKGKKKNGDKENPKKKEKKKHYKLDEAKGKIRIFFTKDMA